VIAIRVSIPSFGLTAPSVVTLKPAIHVSHLSRGNTEILGRARESACYKVFAGFATTADALHRSCPLLHHSGFVRAFAPLGGWSMQSAGPDIHLQPQARRPSQKIECVFSASPET
jgi:hypothetical protein